MAPSPEAGSGAIKYTLQAPQPSMDESWADTKISTISQLNYRMWVGLADLHIQRLKWIEFHRDSTALNYRCSNDGCILMPMTPLSTTT